MLGPRQAKFLRRYRDRVHPALRSTIRRRLRPTRRPQVDLVSIVIPFYNVEDYFEECLRSVVQQGYRKLQIILVDDGSADGSLAIARSYARWDRRIRIIRQPNQGLGAARNTGVAAARGKYLCFADSDDTLPRTSIALMVRTLEKTGSDFVVGALHRLVESKLVEPPWVSQVHAVDRLHITLDEHPEILRDVFAWNKLFVRDFFTRVVREFPAGIRYEDQEPTARAFVAGRFDVLRASVYNWRKREDGTSLTQQKSDPVDLHERLEVKRRVSVIIEEGASRPTFESWLAKAVGFDLRPYFEQVPRTDDAFWQQLRLGVLGLSELITDDIWRKVWMVDRYPALAVVADRREDVVEFMTRRDEYGWSFPGEVRDGAVELSPRYLEAMTYVPPAPLLRLADHDVRLVARITSWQWQGTCLRLGGVAYLTNAPSEPGTGSIRLTATNREGLSVPLATRTVTDPRIDRESNDAWNTHAGGRFTAELDCADLDQTSSAWVVTITVDCAGVSRSGPLKERDVRGMASRLPVAPGDATGRWVVAVRSGVGLTVRHQPAGRVRAAAVTVDDEAVTVTLAEADPAVTGLQVTSSTLRRTVAAVAVADGGGRVYRVTLPRLKTSAKSRAEHSWTVQALLGTQVRAVTAGVGLEVPTDGRRRVRAAVRPGGALTVVQSAWSIYVDQVQLDSTTLTVHGSLDLPGGTLLATPLVIPDHELEADTVVRAGAGTELGTFTSTFDLTRSPLPTKRHTYALRAVVELGGTRFKRWVRVAPSLGQDFPVELAEGPQALNLTKSARVSALRVRFRHPFQPDERGRLAQRRLHQTYQYGRTAAGLADAVLFESFNGKAATDSSRGLFEELRRRDLGLDLYWTVDDLGRGVPDGATPLLLHSRRYLQLLHSARYLVNNSNFAFYFRKNPDQTYVQTWHGTPLKRIGRDVPMANLSLPYRRLMQREPGYWDFLLAQNDFSVDTLPTAFGYSGPVLNEGYPRNDALVAPGAGARREQVRAELGLDRDAVVVLYAPTWRDTSSTSRGYSLVSYLDFGAVKAALGSRGAVLLRGHANTSRSAEGAVASGINVTDHPSINDLILAADVLVTDYSSVMFDFCITGKPMIFLTPDLAEYRDRTRGFYLDLEEMAPGPVCMSSSEVVAALTSLDQVVADYGARYAAFRDTYAPRDDGRASSRVVDRIWRPKAS